jgi:hypothetical protein
VSIRFLANCHPKHALRNHGGCLHQGRQPLSGQSAESSDFLIWHSVDLIDRSLPPDALLSATALERRREIAIE